MGKSLLYLQSKLIKPLISSFTVIAVENGCFTSNGTPGICKTQQQCTASQSSSGASSSKNELFSETCRIENDGTPVVCCILNADSDQKDSTTFTQEDGDTYTYVEQDSSGSSQNSSKQSNASDIESRFFNGPRKRQYYNYNVIPQYEPISYNDVYSYQNKKPNDVNNVQNYNSFAFESPVNQPNQYKPSNNNINYNSYNTPSRNPTSRPATANNNPQTWQSSQSYSQQATRRPTVQQSDVIFKQTGSGSSRLSTVTNRYNPSVDYWSTAQTTRRYDIQPVWGEVAESTTTTRVIRTPRPTESYQSNQNQNVYRPTQNQNQNNQNQNQYNQNQNQNNQNQNQYNPNQNQNNQNQNQNNQNQNTNRPTQTQQRRISEQSK